MLRVVNFNFSDKLKRIFRSPNGSAAEVDSRDLRLHFRGFRVEREITTPVNYLQARSTESPA